MRGLAAFLLFAATSILVFGLPVMGDLAHRCVGSCLPDTSLYVWSFDWMAHALGNGLDPLFTDQIWAPAGVHLAWVTTLPGPSLLMEPVTSRFGGLVSVNILMLAAPALAAWATYLLCVRLTHRFWASVMGGFVFGFSTYINQHERAQLNLLLVFFVPLAVYLVVRRVEGSIGRIVFVVLLALVLAGEFATSTEVLATMTMFGGLAYRRSPSRSVSHGPCRCSPWPTRERRRSRRPSSTDWRTMPRPSARSGRRTSTRSIC
jgi:hypothetical protein